MATPEEHNNIMQTITDNFNVDEVFTDLARVANVPVEQLLSRFPENKIYNGLFGGMPAHCNFYHILARQYQKTIPKWFQEKYSNVEFNQYDGFLEQ